MIESNNFVLNQQELSKTPPGPEKNRTFEEQQSKTRIGCSIDETKLSLNTEKN